MSSQKKRLTALMALLIILLLIETQSKRIKRQSKLISHFMTSGGLYNIMKEVNAMPKVVSATGQIYVDYEEVMKILEGGDIIER